MRTGTELYAYDKKKGTLVHTFADRSAASDFLKVDDVSHIYKSITGKRCAAFGYIWLDKRVSNVLVYKATLYNIVCYDRWGSLLWQEESYEDAAKRLAISTNIMRKAVYDSVSCNMVYRNKYRFSKQLRHKIK